MTRSIMQSVNFPAPPAKLFAIYTDSARHFAATGAKASVSAEAARFASETFEEHAVLSQLFGQELERHTAAHWVSSAL